MGVFRVVVQVAEKMAREERCSTVVKMIKLGEDDHVVEARWRVCEASSLMTVARTMDQQLGKAEETATSPHQYAVSTMAGCECIAHILQGAFDLNPRGAMMLHLLGFCGTFSSGTAHAVAQGEGGEHGDPAMPQLFALGQQAGLEAAKRPTLSMGPLTRFLGRHVHCHSTGNVESRQNSYSWC